MISGKRSNLELERFPKEYLNECPNFHPGPGAGCAPASQCLWNSRTSGVCGQMALYGLPLASSGLPERNLITQFVVVIGAISTYVSIVGRSSPDLPG